MTDEDEPPDPQKNSRLVEKTQTKKPIPFETKILASPEDYSPTGPDFEVIGTFNPGVTQIGNNGKIETLLYVRVAEAPKKQKDHVPLPFFHIPNRKNNDLRLDYDTVPKNEIKNLGKKEAVLKSGHCRLRHISLPKILILNENKEITKREQSPAIYPAWEFERFGIEDTRITKFEDGRYFVTYSSPHRDFGVRSSILDLENILEGNHKRVILENTPRPEVLGKDVVLFPEKVPSPSSTKTINNNEKLYAAFTRPNAFDNLSTPGIWISYSPDLVHWGQEHRLTNEKISGTGAPPVKIGDKWIEPYHETTRTGNSIKYVTRILSLDHKNPWKVLNRSPVLIERSDLNELLPEKGYVPNVIFTTGMITNGDRTDLYHGIDDKWTVLTSYYTEDILKFTKRKE